MDKKDISEVSSGLRNTFQKAIEAEKKHNAEYALDLFKSVVKKEPAFVPAREALRNIERQLTAKLGAFTKFSSAIKSKLKSGKIRSAIRKNPIEAMGMAEDLLAVNLSDPNALNLLADAALAADTPWIAIEAYSIFREFAPKNEGNLRNLAAVYKQIGEGTKVLSIFQEISTMHPGDLGVDSELKAAAALASLEKGNWDSDGDFRGKLKDENQADSLEKDDRIARAEDDVADMIARLEKNIADGDDSIDTCRKIAEYYHRAAIYDKCITAYERIIEKMGVLDPMIDGKIEKARLAQIDVQINEAKNQNLECSELEAAKYTDRIERAVARVNGYPNDYRLRYALGIVYWDGGYVDEALEQFQMAQNSPQHRLSAIMHMGLCFQQKGQLDLAASQLERVVADTRGMGNDKKEALYHLGVVYADQGNNEKAGDCFKQI